MGKSVTGLSWPAARKQASMTHTAANFEFQPPTIPPANATNASSVCNIYCYFVACAAVRVAQHCSVGACVCVSVVIVINTVRSAAQVCVVACVPLIYCLHHALSFAFLPALQSVPMLTVKWNS